MLLAVHLDRRAEAERVGTGDRDPRVVDRGAPRGRSCRSRSGSRARSASARSPSRPSTMRTMSGASPRGGMKSIARTRALVGLEDRLEDQRVVPVAAARPAHRRRRARAASARARASPSSAAKQAPESKRGKQHQSIEPVAADERRRLQVADQRVVLDARHAPIVGRQGAGRTCSVPHGHATTRQTARNGRCEQSASLRRAPSPARIQSPVVSRSRKTRRRSSTEPRVERPIGQLLLLGPVEQVEEGADLRLGPRRPAPGRQPQRCSSCSSSARSPSVSVGS